VIVCFVLVSSFLLPHNVLYNLTPECEWQAQYGIPCPLCGMTHSFTLISSGRFSEAMAVNQHSLFLYAIFFFNSMLFLCIVLKWTLIDSPGKTIKVLLIQNSPLGCASVSGHSPQTRSFAPAASLTRVRLRNFCLRKRPSFLASRRFAQENPTPRRNDLLELIK